MVWKKRAKNSTFSIHGNDAIIIDKIEMNFTKMWREKGKETEGMGKRLK